MKILTKDEILGIDPDLLPMPVLSFNYRNVVSSLINIRKKSHYNHFLWYYEPGWFASQGMFFSVEKVEKYLSHHRLKFWHNPDWSKTDRAILKSCIEADLNKPLFTTFYDLPAIVGQALGLGFIQLPWLKICSDYAGYLGKIDGTYHLKHPAPNDVNEWFKDRDYYKVWGRYIRD